jgi:tetratricopeptide (TPR) repeat protein
VQAVLSMKAPAQSAAVTDGGVYRVLGLDLRADILAAHGRFDDAAALYREAAIVPVSTFARDGFMACTEGAERVRLAFLLALLGDPHGARAPVEEALALQPDNTRWLYASGLFALRDGDAATARDRLATLVKVLGDPDWSASGAIYRDALTAELALAEGRAAEARDGFSALLASGQLMDDWYSYEDTIAPLLRDGLARASLAAGDVAGTSAALGALIDSGFERLRHPVPWVLALEQRGELELQLGHAAEGRALLERFVRQWGAADHELPAVTKARALLAAH